MTTLNPQELAAALAEASAPSKPAPKQSAYDADVNVSFFGVMNVLVDFVPARLSNKVDFKTVCPVCDNPHSMAQRYVCVMNPAHCDGNQDDLPGFSSGSAGRAREINGTLVGVTPDEIKAIKQAKLPGKDLPLIVYSAAEVERHTRPSGTAYRLRPKNAAPIYAMLVDLVADTTKAYIGEMAIRDSDKLFRIEAWNGQLVATELARPTETAPADVILNREYQPKLLEMARQLADVNLEPFDPERFANSVKERMRKFEADKLAAGAAPQGKAKKDKPKSSADLQAALLATLEASLQRVQGA